MHKSYSFICLLGAIVLAAASALASTATDATSILRQLGLETGQWHTTIRIVAAEIVPIQQGTEIPPEARAQIESKVGSSFETDDCIGASSDASGALILPGINVAKSCVLSDIHAMRSELVLSAACGGASNGFGVRTKVHATLGSRSMKANVDVSSVSPGVGSITNLALATSSKYVGACRLR